MGDELSRYIQDMNEQVLTVDYIAQHITDMFFPPEEGVGGASATVLYKACQLLKGSLAEDDSRILGDFTQHCKRFLNLYNFKSGVEVDRSERYSHKTGKVEAKVIATKKWYHGDEIKLLQGVNTDLTREEEEGLGGQDDFSVMYSAKRKCSRLFTGPGRFVNHDCTPNVNVRRFLI